MNRKVSPQENKIRDYLSQRTNCYGENSKSSRKAIRVRKSWVNRSYRRRVNITLNVSHDNWELAESEVNSSKRQQWKKLADECLLKSLEHKWSGSSRTEYVSFDKTVLQRKARKRLSRMNTRYYWY